MVLSVAYMLSGFVVCPPKGFDLLLERGDLGQQLGVLQCHRRDILFSLRGRETRDDFASSVRTNAAAHRFGEKLIGDDVLVVKQSHRKWVEKIRFEHLTAL